MSQHRSLRSRSAARQHRNVLKRYERLKALSAADRWKEGDPVWGLPKVRSIKERFKKGKAAPAGAADAAAAPAEGAQAPGGGAEAGPQDAGQ